MLTPTYSEDFNEVWDARPPAPVGDKVIEISVVGKSLTNLRCIYINNFRSVGSKPYVSEGLTYTEKETTLIEILNAFSEADILEALAEQQRRKDYIAGYHAWKKTQENPDDPR